MAFSVRQHCIVLERCRVMNTDKTTSKASAGAESAIKDDRTSEERETHRYAVVAKDRFMSGWGEAKNGASWCAWACETHSDACKAAEWVRNRSEMRYVKVKFLPKYKVPASAVQFHIYVVNADHPALNFNAETAVAQ